MTHSRSPKAHMRWPIGAAFLAIVLHGCSNAPAPTERSEPLPVEVERAARPADGSIIRGAGTVRWQREAVLSFRVSGTLATLNVDIGDTIGRGQLLAELDATDFNARLARATAEVERAQRALERYQTLSEAGAVSRAQSQDQRNILEQARAAQAEAAFDRQSARLRAVNSGVVLERIAQTGETVSPGQPVLRVADTTSPLLVRAPIPSHAVVQLKLGSKARFWPSDRDTGAFNGEIIRIGRQVDARTGTVDVDIRIDDTRNLVSGMIGNVEIEIRRTLGRDLVAVPAEAIVEAKGANAFVFLLDTKSSRVHRRPVRFAGFSGDDALISGIAPGTPIIVSGAGFAVDGQAVRVAAGDKF